MRWIVLHWKWRTICSVVHYIHLHLRLHLHLHINMPLKHLKWGSLSFVLQISGKFCTIHIMQNRTIWQFDEAHRRPPDPIFKWLCRCLDINSADICTEHFMHSQVWVCHMQRTTRVHLFSVHCIVFFCIIHKYMDTCRNFVTRQNNISHKYKCMNWIC